ncbi:MAG: hypothetical protein AVDCRST_MAG36-646 [uncultured Nocardioidaceae bacterium]|uniref:HTH gntR-type domain-containing protein n=1 Tax=uncultured Nocardioidaceae bacterium TaxID=253824 RepID=A0A6J4LAC7_9ACTN|nr:MAG: hypothetical protein AVDCRST_MAG36-646 [uncultured Nocardioidaceae bacterium]
MDWQQVRTRSLSRPDRLVIELERMIVSGELPSGARVPPERDLARMLDVSRTSVREALRDLARRGLIDRRPGRGTLVAHPGASPTGDALVSGLGDEEAALARIMEVRACVEPAVAARAAQRATPRDVEALRAILERQERAAPGLPFADLDRAFHAAIAMYTQNPLLSRLLDNISDLVEPSRGVHLQSAGRRRTSLAEHRLIFDAIAAGDAEAARDGAAEHVRSVERLVLAASASRAAAHARPADLPG